MLSVFLQAVGVLFLLWIVCGWLVLSGQRGGACIRLCHAGQWSEAERFLRACIWLREMGLLLMPVVLVDQGLNPWERAALHSRVSGHPGVHICDADELPEFLEKEVGGIGRTGSAAGDCVGNRISEL